MRMQPKESDGSMYYVPRIEEWHFNVNWQIYITKGEWRQFSPIACDREVLARLLRRREIRARYFMAYDLETRGWDTLAPGYYCRDEWNLIFKNHHETAFLWRYSVKGNERIRFQIPLLIETVDDWMFVERHIIEEFETFTAKTIMHYEQSTQELREDAPGNDTGDQ